MTPLLWMANILGWPVIQLTIAFVALRLPQSIFARDSWLTVPRSWERHGLLYRDWFAIRRWKHLLPDGAPWIGGFAKKSFRSRDPAYIAQFMLETRRAEVAHWCMIACLPLFFLWNPAWARWVMFAYAIVSNLPCILAQRYNRLVLDRLGRIRRHAHLSL
jgi:glycosyl-4,4'-diaponeurosporenoate acyltransferase